MTVHRLCKWCGSDKHTSFSCFKKPRKPLARSTKSIAKIGKYGKQWIVTRDTWKRKNPPDVHGFYVCHICKLPVHYKAVTIDHIQSRSRHPELRYVLSNLAPAHWECNTAKGSKDLDEL